MRELIEQIERADGPSRELDVEIARAIGHPAIERPGFICAGYTGSIDAALTLVPKGCAAAVGTMFGTPGMLPWACIWTPQGKPKSCADCATPALALCAAALKAKDADNADE